MTTDDGQNGTCYTPCDCGVDVPSGEYLYDLRNASARAFIIEDLLGPTALGNPNISGLYLDDYWYVCVCVCVCLQEEEDCSCTFSNFPLV